MLDSSSPGVVRGWLWMVDGGRWTVDGRSLCMHTGPRAMLFLVRVTRLVDIVCDVWVYYIVLYCRFPGKPSLGPHSLIVHI